MTNGVNPSPGGILGQGVSQKQILASRVKAGSSWFLWIAILSIINSLIARAQGGLSFVVGLGMTQVFDGVAKGMRPEGGSLGTASIVALLLDILVAGLFVLFWRLTQQGHVSAFATGMVLYGIDGLLFVMSQDYLSIAFHVFALFRIFQGLRAGQALQRLLAAERFAGASPVTPT